MNLLPLKISQGWEVLKNHFYDVDHETNKNSDGELDYPFYEDVLVLRNRVWRITIDLSWLPDCSPEGRYKLILLKWQDDKHISPTPKNTIKKKIDNNTLMYKLHYPVFEDWDSPVKEFESRNRFEVQEKINEYLATTQT